MEVRKATVVGSGIMGSGIAQVISQAGIPVAVFDSFPEALKKGESSIRNSLSRMLKSGKVTEEQVNTIMGRITFTGSMEEALKDSDIAIEAVPEILDLKKDVFKKIEGAALPSCILATNTSNIRITEIADSLKNPERLVGMHFFNPPVIMKLVEVIKGEKTSESAFQSVFDFAKKLGKTAIKVNKDTAGFVVNRISAPESLFFSLIVDRKMDKPEAVDAFAKSQGLPMGPYELMDYVGVDTVFHSLEYYSRELDPDYGKAKIIGDMIKEKKLGSKTGQGFYQWENGKAKIPAAAPSNAVEIMDIFTLEINEAVKLIEDGVAEPADIEKGFCLGMNRPFGPISVAENLTSKEVKERLEQIHGKFGINVFSPAKSIMEGKLKEIIKGKPKQKQAAAKETPSGENLVNIVREGNVARLELNNGKNNLLNANVLKALHEAIDELWNDREIRVVVVAGNGNVFSAGAELTQYIPDAFEFMEHSRRGERTFRLLSEMPKIVIAEMKKYALGGGFELSLNCDIRISTPDCVVGFPEVRIGLLPGWSGSQRLSKLVGMSRATALILSGEKFTGSKAYEYGIVYRTYDEAQLKEKTMEFAAELASSVSPIAAALSKKLINKGSEVPMDVGLDMESIAMGTIYASKDFMEGISAFVQKRKPEYKFQ